MITMLKQRATVTMLSSFQWLFFIFANTLVVPISVGAAFQLPAEIIEMTIRYSFIFTGLACILQAWIGHRYPLMEGHSGLMWGLLLNMGISASALGLDFATVGGGIATGILLSGAVTVLIALFNLISIVQKIVTPMVISVYIFLLTFHLIFIFFKGMFKISENGTIDLPVSLFSIGVVFFVSLLKIKGGKGVGNFSILIGIIVGWLLYRIIFPSDFPVSSSGNVAFTIFPFGTPNLELGIIFVAFVAGLLNLTNTFASIKATADLYKEEVNNTQYKRSIFVTGFLALISAIFGLVPFTPFTSTIGFLESTNLLKKTPFIISGFMFMSLGFIPSFVGFLGTMPLTVGNAVLFVAYLQLFGTSLNSLKGTFFNSITIFRIAGPVLIGVSIMNFPPELFGSVPALFLPLLSNGLMMGVFLSIFMEKFIDWDKFTVEMEVGK
ncbi:uracil/xanthine transporter [Sporosarcina sp. JAI121]|uniref:uracil/xanthine transporter n=1 Tax=Sporosarcina sp. JAI121 TaxID=2723064 RepID=UPI00185CC894|nr:uracil/xanthine transporter [Sporosarcina sp. JAI121]NYF24840.1 xanthine/uracil permease [Sporosarcina sp. JAI121]